MMKMAAVLVAASFAAAAQADVIASWTFETSVPATAGPHAPEVGSGSALGSHASGSAVYSNPAGNGSPESFSSNFWSVGDYYQFQVDATGYEEISITWDQTSSSTGPRDFDLQWSTDGINFTTITAYQPLVNGAPNPPWNATTSSPLYTNSVTGPGNLDGQATVYFRLTQTTNIAENGGTVAGTGTDRVDNIIIEGSPVPTPGSFALLGLGGLVAMRRRR